MEDLFSLGFEDKIEAAKASPCRTIRLLSLFSGIGAFEKALDKCNIPYDLVAYCEIDKYASVLYQRSPVIWQSKGQCSVSKCIGGVCGE